MFFSFKYNFQHKAFVPKSPCCNSSQAPFSSNQCNTRGSHGNALVTSPALIINRVLESILLAKTFFFLFFLSSSVPVSLERCCQFVKPRQLYRCFVIVILNVCVCVYVMQVQAEATDFSDTLVLSSQ